MKIIPLTLAALMLSAPVANAQALEGAVPTKAIVNSIGEDMANVSHDPIPEIGWPAMTMDLALSPDMEMTEDVAAGDTVTLMLIQGADGMYVIGAMVPQ